MVSVSEYENKKELRRIHDRGVTLKTGESIFIALLGIVPPVKVIGDIIFSLADAERDQAIEDFIGWAQVKFLEHGIDISDLGKTQNDIRENLEKNIKQQNIKFEEIQREVSALYRSARYLSQQEQQKILESIKENYSILESINEKEDITLSKMDDLLARLDKGNSSEKIIEDLGNKLLYGIEKRIESGELIGPLNQIESIVSHAQFVNFNDELTVDFLAIYGKILFNLNLKDHLEKVIEKLLELDTVTKRKCSLIFIYSVDEHNRDLFDLTISGYRKLDYEESKIEVLSQYYNFASGKINKIVKSLCYKNKSGEYNVKRRYQKIRRAYEYVGLAFFIQGDFIKSKKFLAKANELKNSLIYKYRLLYCDAGFILSRIGSIKTLTNNEIEILTNVYDELSKHELFQYFSERPVEISVEYWRIRLLIQMYLVKGSALKEYELIPDGVKEHPEIQIKYGDLLLSTGKVEEAQLIFNELYKKSKNPEVLSRIFDSLMIEEKYAEILKIADTITDEGHYEHVFICKSIVAATFLTEGFEKANHLTEKYLKKVEDPTILLFEIGHLNASVGQLEHAIKYFEMCCNSIPKDDYPLRTEIARECSYLGLDDLSIKILKPFIKYNENGKKQYIDLVLHFRKENLYQEAEEIINEEIAKSVDRKPWLKRKIDLENFRGQKNTSLKTGEELFELTKSPNVAYNLMVLKSELGLADYSKYSDVLSIQKDPVYVMAAAICYKYDGNILFAKEFAYKALALDRSDFNEILFAQYVQLHLFNFPKKDLPKITQVGTNNSIHLKNREDLWITIDSDKALFGDLAPFKFAGSVHYHEEHDDVIDLLDKHLGEKINFNGKEYEITEILSNYVSAFQYCFKTYTKNVPDSDLFWSIPVDLNNPLQSIIPELEKMRNSDSEMIERYNNLKELGIPLWIMAIKKGRSLADVMVFLLEKRKQPFYTGEIRKFNFKNINIVLSPTSILILSFLNILETITSHYKIFITQSTKEYFKSLVQRRKFDENSSAALGINDDGRPFFEEIREEDRNKRRKFFKSIYDILKNMNIQIVELSPEELDNKKTMINLIGKPDYESMLLTKRVNGVYVADDLFLRKIFNLKYQDDMHSNSISILFEHGVDNIGEFIKIQKKLSEWDYQRLFNSEMISDAVKSMNNHFRVIGSGTTYDLFKMVIHNSLKIKNIFSVYEMELLNAIFKLFELRMVQNYEYCFRLVLKEIVMYYSFYGFDVLILKAKIKVLLGKYPPHKKYFLDLLDDVLGNIGHI